MISSQEMLGRISNLLGRVHIKLRRAPDDRRLQYLDAELNRLRTLVVKNWPVSDEDRSSFSLGLFAARELEDFHPDLADDVYYIAGRLDT